MLTRSRLSLHRGYPLIRLLRSHLLPMGEGRKAHADPFHVVMVALLRQADFGLKAENLRAVFAELAIHPRVAQEDVVGALDERIQHQWVVAEIGRLDQLDLR